MIKFVKAGLVILSTIFLAFLVIFAPDIANVCSMFYVGLIGVFLGVDMIAMVKKTKQLEGEFKKIKIWRIIVSTSCVIILFVLTFFVNENNQEMTITLTSLASCVYIMFSILLAGLDANRIATIDNK